MIRKRQTLRALFARLLGDRRGAAFVYTAILMPAFIGFIGLGVDIGLWHVHKRETQAIADAAAIAGAMEIMRMDDIDQNANVSNTAMSDALENGFDAGDGDTIIVNNPPLAGNHTSNAGAVEVIIRRPAPQIFSAVLGLTDSFISSRAVAFGDSSDTCLWALNPEERGAITVAGGAQVNMACGVLANSNDPSAITLNGGACLNATEVLAVGGASSGCVSPAVSEGSMPQSDPLVGLEAPVSTGCDHVGQTRIQGGDATISPGTYCGNVTLNTAGTVTMEPGIYIMDGAGFTINAQTTVVGDGVTIYFTAGGHINDNVTINGGADVTLSAPLTGPMAGVLFYHDRNGAAASHRFTGGADMQLTGIIYAPNQSIDFVGGSSLEAASSMIIADMISFSGSSYVAALPPDTGPMNPLFVEVRLVE